MQKRLARLATKICPTGDREFTLEELCRYWWRINKRGFLAFMKKDFPALQVFADSFEREDLERISAAERSSKLRHV